MTMSNETGPPARPRVYVPQRPTHRDEVTGEIVAKFPDLEQRAGAWGDVVYLLSDTARPFGPDVESIVDELHAKLRHVRPCDYLLLVGSPTLITWAAVIMAGYTDDRLRLLQFAGKGQQRYVEIYADLAPLEDEP